MVLAKKERVGETNFNSYGYKITVVNYNSERDIEVIFEDGFIKKCSYSRFKSGNVKNNNMPSKYGVAYIGNTSTKVDGVEKSSYRVWVGILDRVYGKRIKSYEDVSISKEWLSYANFESWYGENIYKVENEKMCIDKDILSNSNNKVYSKETCLIIPERINNLLIKFYDKETGITYREKRNVYEVSCRDLNGVKTYLGFYDNKEYALKVYKDFKIKTILEVIGSYKCKLPSKIYDLLITKFLK